MADTEVTFRDKKLVKTQYGFIPVTVIMIAKLHQGDKYHSLQSPQTFGKYMTISSNKLSITSCSTWQSFGSFTDLSNMSARAASNEINEVVMLLMI